MHKLNTQWIVKIEGTQERSLVVVFFGALLGILLLVVLVEGIAGGAQGGDGGHLLLDPVALLVLRVLLGLALLVLLSVRTQMTDKDQELNIVRHLKYLAVCCAHHHCTQL